MGEGRLGGSFVDPLNSRVTPDHVQRGFRDANDGIRPINKALTFIRHVWVRDQFG